MNREKDYPQETQKLYNLMLKIKEDSRSGMQEFYDEYGKFLYNVANTYKCSEIEPNEVVQEVLTKIWKNSKNPKKIKNPKGWLYKITINCGHSLARKRRSHCSFKEEIFASKSNMEEFIEVDSFDYMTRKLSIEEKQIIIRKLIVKESFKEIAKSIRRPAGSVASTYYRAIDKIKADYEKNLEKFFKK